MSVQLDHTIVPARDKHESAQFLSEILGVAEPVAMGHFVAVAIDHGLTLDFADSEEPIRPIHFAFRVTEAEFDEVFGRVTDRGLPYWADPRRFARHLGVHRRPRRVLQTGREIAFVQVEQRLQRLGRRVEALPRITEPGHPLGDGRERQLVGMDGVELVPRERRRHLGARAGGPAR